MNLGEFHTELARFRKNQNMNRYEFIGKLLETASDDVVYQPDYETSCRHVFSQSDHRVVVSAIKANSILSQKETHITNVIEFVKNEIQSLRLQTIIDKINVTEQIPPDQTISQYIESRILSDDQIIVIYATYIAEYFYFTLFWNQVTSSIPVPEDFKSRFRTDSEFYEKIIRVFQGG